MLIFFTIGLVLVLSIARPGVDWMCRSMANEVSQVQGPKTQAMLNFLEPHKTSKDQVIFGHLDMGPQNDSENKM